MQGTLRNSTGEISIDGKARALEQLGAMRSRSSSMPPKVAGIPTRMPINIQPPDIDQGDLQNPRGMAAPSGPALGDPIEATAGLPPTIAGWTAIGPGNIGGRTRSMVIDPNNTSRLYAGGVAGGVVAFHKRRDYVDAT